jgi:fibronectin type 3 domain-containing protein
VIAVNGEGESVASIEVSATPASVPTAPQSLQTTYSDSQVALTWTPPSDDGGSTITEYMVYRSTSPSDPFTNVGNSTTLNYIDSTVSNGITYWYNVTAVNAEGEGPSSNQVSTTPATVPTAPLNPLLVPGNSQISVSWETPADDGGSPIIRYRIYRRFASGSFINIRNVSSVLLYLDSNVTNGITYFYIILAVNGEGESVASVEVSTTPLAVPNSPQNLIITYAESIVTLSWVVPSDDGGSSIIQYRIYRSNTTGGPYTNIANTTLLSFNDTSATKGITYFYAVCAINSLGESLRSNEASIIPATIPGPPEGLFSRLDIVNHVILSWNEPSDTGGLSISIYQIYRSSTSGGPYTSIGSNSLPSYSDSSVERGTTYFYVVRAVNAMGESINSNEDGVAIPPPITKTSYTTIPQTSVFAFNSLVISLFLILYW